MKWNSFRVRLSLWNSAVLALILGGFGLILYTTTRKQTMATFDHDLSERAQRLASGPFRVPPDLYQRHLMRFDGRIYTPTAGNDPATLHEREHERLASLLDGDAKRLAAVRRPRILDLSGKSIGPYDDAPWDAHAFQKALKGQESFSTITVAGQRLRVYSIPRRVQDGIVGVVQVAGELTPYERNADSQFSTLLVLLPLSLLVAACGGLFLAERALRPVRAVTQAATQISDQDLSRRLAVEGDDELAELACTFNSMISRLDAAFHSREKAYAELAAAYEQQRRFTADASHELRTPLSRIKISASMALSQEQTPEEYRKALEVTDQAADMMGDLIQELLLLARADAGQLAIQAVPLDLADLLRSTIDLCSEPCRAPISLELAAQPFQSLQLQSQILQLQPFQSLHPLIVCGDRDHLRRVFCNLLANALRHTPPDGRVTVSAVRIQDRIVVRVADTGEGIPPEHLPHVMERFYRVDAARARRAGGCGLGLAIAQSIVAAHGGALTLDSQVGCGTVATVVLPTANS